MKKLIFTLALVLPTLYFAQTAQKEIPESCNIETGFKEPKGQYKNQRALKRVGASVDDLKTHISVDRGVDAKSITLLQISEQLGNGIYIVCANGVKYKYRRSGSVFYRDGVENPFEQLNSGK
ncbi:hypothetical protein [Chryseobacterium luteum]|uniref:Uncharacterized protein n=1 Tax=Chryseobacterium luteum TaxID=421531 RepID=A0A085ZU46_9FLAO|nr:hypothetical protein [Chryseobacterium luteum]KFF07960.1 hypothetical protein IX38_07280 [Chryseobacterium luteum]